MIGAIALVGLMFCMGVEISQSVRASGDHASSVTVIGKPVGSKQSHGLSSKHHRCNTWIVTQKIAGSYLL